MWNTFNCILKEASSVWTGRSFLTTTLNINGILRFYKCCFIIQMNKLRGDLTNTSVDELTPTMSPMVDKSSKSNLIDWMLCPDGMYNWQEYVIFRVAEPMYYQHTGMPLNRPLFKKRGYRGSGVYMGKPFITGPIQRRSTFRLQKCVVLITTQCHVCTMSLYTVEGEKTNLGGRKSAELIN